MKYFLLVIFLFLSSCATQKNISNGVCVPDVESPSLIASKSEEFDEPFFKCNSANEGIRLYIITGNNVMYIKILKDEDSTSISVKNATFFFFNGEKEVEMLDYKLKLSEKEWSNIINNINDNNIINIKRNTVKEELSCFNLDEGPMWGPTAKKYILEISIDEEYKFFYIRDIYNNSMYSGGKNRKKPDNGDVLTNFIYYLIDYAILKYSDKNIEKYKADEWDNRKLHIKNYCPPIENQKK